MQNQQFDPDRAELEAHFAERVRAYIELGETEEQAEASAKEKFGNTESVLRTLRWQQIRKHPLMTAILAGLLWLAGYLPLALSSFTVYIRWMHTSQNLGEQGPYIISIWVTTNALLAFLSALASAGLLGKRGLHQSRAIFLGILVACIISAPVREPLAILLTATPALLGSLGCITLIRCRKLQKKV